MRGLLKFLIFTVPFAAQANEALDVLEGRVDANSVVLPPSPFPQTAADDEERVENLIYLEPDWAASPPDAIWSRSILYEDAGNPWIQQVALSGYFDFQASFGEMKTDGVDPTPSRNTDLDGTRTRRARLGARIRAFNHTEIEAVGEMAGDSEYRGIERLKATTRLGDGVGVTYGKFQPNFGTESRVEEQLSPFPRRAMLFNMVAPSPSLGASFYYAGEAADYHIGYFSNTYDPEIPSWGGGGLLNLSVSKSFVERSGDSLAQTRVHMDYLHNFDPGNSNPMGYSVQGRSSANGNQLIVQNPAYRHLFSVGVSMDSDRYSLTGDFQLARGETTVWGMSAGATYWAIPGTLKLVGRYQYAGTDDALGILAAPGNSGDLRYDSSPFFAGDEFHSFYLGANLHLYKDEVVLRNGVEYSILKDEAGAGFDSDSLIWHSGASISF